MGLFDWLGPLSAGKPRGWDALPAPRSLAIPEQKSLTFNGAEYVPPLVHGPGATELLEILGGGYGQVDGNSAVFACLMALGLAYFEPPVRVYRTDRKGNREPDDAHPLQAVLDAPNPWHSQRELWFWVAWALNLDGNAYLEKARAGNATRGNVVQLIPRSPRLVKPQTERNSNNLIDRYRFEFAPGKFDIIPVENMVHLRLGMDDRDMRLGISPLKRMLRHVVGDDEAARFATTLLGNYGLPGLTVTMPGKAPSREEAEEIKERIRAAYGSGNRGNVGVLFDGATMAQFGFSPEQLNLKALHQIPETRIAAIMRVPPAVAGLSVGLEQTSNFASFSQIREQFVEQTLVPLWALRDDKLDAQLLPDFSSDPAMSVATDLTQVRALQVDENALHVRANADLMSGGISLNEYRHMIGQDPLPDPQGNVHFIPANLTPTPVDAIGAAPEPVVPPADQQQQDGEQAAGLRVVGGR